MNCTTVLYVTLAEWHVVGDVGPPGPPGNNRAIYMHACLHYIIVRLIKLVSTYYRTCLYFLMSMIHIGSTFSANCCSYYKTRTWVIARALSRRHRRKKFRLAAAAEKNLAKPAWPNFFSGFSRRKKNSASRKPYSLKTRIFRFGIDLDNSLVSQTSPLYHYSLSAVKSLLDTPDKRWLIM